MKVLVKFEPTAIGDFLVVVEDHHYKDVTMEFAAYECKAMNSDGCYVYEMSDSVCSLDMSPDHEKCQAFLEGSLTWDGVFNVKFSEQETGFYLRFYGLEDTDKIQRLFNKLYSIADECISKWDVRVVSHS